MTGSYADHSVGEFLDLVAVNVEAGEGSDVLVRRAAQSVAITREAAACVE